MAMTSLKTKTSKAPTVGSSFHGRLLAAAMLSLALPLGVAGAAAK